MKTTKFLGLSIGFNTLVVLTLTAVIILPHWYFGLGKSPQLYMEISLIVLIIFQILLSLFTYKKNILQFSTGIIPIIIPVLYYTYIARPCIIAYM